MNTSDDIQYITRSVGPFGDELIPAPSGWKFDDGTTEAWYWLVAFSRSDIRFKTKRDAYVNDARREILAQVLANTLGMASPYWLRCATEIHQ